MLQRAALALDFILDAAQLVAGGLHARAGLRQHLPGYLLPGLGHQAQFALHLLHGRARGAFVQLRRRLAAHLDFTLRGCQTAFSGSELLRRFDAFGFRDQAVSLRDLESLLRRSQVMVRLGRKGRQLLLDGDQLALNRSLSFDHARQKLLPIALHTGLRREQLIARGRQRLLPLHAPRIRGRQFAIEFARDFGQVAGLQPQCIEARFGVREVGDPQLARQDHPCQVAG